MHPHAHLKTRAAALPSPAAGTAPTADESSAAH
jgi:hypothetical protein